MSSFMGTVKGQLPTLGKATLLAASKFLQVRRRNDRCLGGTRLQLPVIVDRIFADDRMPALADAVLHGPAQCVSGDDRRHEADRALGDSTDDRSLDSAVAV